MDYEIFVHYRVQPVGPHRDPQKLGDHGLAHDRFALRSNMLSTLMGLDFSFSKIPVDLEFQALGRMQNLA